MHGFIVWPEGVMLSCFPFARLEMNSETIEVDDNSLVSFAEVSTRRGNFQVFVYADDIVVETGEDLEEAVHCLLWCLARVLLGGRRSGTFLPNFHLHRDPRRQTNFNPNDGGRYRRRLSSAALSCD